MRAKITLLIGVFFSSFLLSQGIASIPPSPSSAQFTKYVDTPVTLTNGLAAISIPLFELEQTGLTVPVELNYHSGGIKVEEIASEVGLGWSLNLGGRISRVMKGKPDDMEVKGFMYTTPLTPQNVYNQVVQDKIDTQADTFVFNFLNYSGSFSYDKSSQSFVQFPLSDLKIQPIIDSNSAEIKGFSFTTPEGLEYYFGTTKEGLRNAVNTYFSTISYLRNKNTSIIVPDQPSYSYINTWHLTEIISENDKKIEFFYGLALPLQQLLRTDQYITYSSTNANYQSPPAAASVPITDLYPSTHYIVANGSDMYLQKVQGKSASIELDYSLSAREDLQNAKSLSRIKLKQNGSTEYLLYELDYSYFTSEPSSDSFINSFGTHYTKRLKLDRINLLSHKNGADHFQNSHSLTYSNLQLPNRFSYNQDYWGYYNGADNSSLIPEYYFGIVAVSPQTGKADRAVNPRYAQANVLTKIQYPTKGTVSYSYESNLASKVGFKDENRKNNLKNYTSKKTLNFVKNLEYKTGIANYETTFTLDAVLGNTSIKSSISNCGALPSFDCGFLVRLQGLDDPSSYNLTTKNYDLALPNGRYKLTAMDMDPSNPANDFSVSVSWTIDGNDVVQDSDPSEMFVGGLRVQSVVLDPLKGPKIEKNFSYLSDRLRTNNSGYFSSGSLISAPVLRSDALIDNKVIYRVSSRSNYPAVAIGATVMHYEKVTEVTGQKSKSEYYFDSVGDIQNTIGDSGSFYCDSTGNCVTSYFQNLKDSHFTDRRGKLLVRKDYRASATNQSFSLFRQETNTYSESREYLMPNFSAIAEIGSGYGPAPMRYYVYSQRSAVNFLSKKVTEYFFEEPLKIESVFKYENPLHYQKTSEIITQSDGKTNLTTYQYAHEKANAYLIGKNKIGIPLQIMRSGSLNGVSKTHSNILFNYPVSSAEASTKSSGLALPYSILSYDLQNPTSASVEMTYDKYDPISGNLLQYTPKSGIPISLVWGYHNTLPIAKVEGVTYAQLSGLISSIVSKSNEDLDELSENALITALDTFRKQAALAGAQITTYTYDPVVGVTSVTPPSGKREIYRYDTASRLEHVIDVNGNTLNTYQYHYQP